MIEYLLLKNLRKPEKKCEPFVLDGEMLVETTNRITHTTEFKDHLQHGSTRDLGEVNGSGLAFSAVKSVMVETGVDVQAEGSKKTATLFTIGIGNTSLFYFDTFCNGLFIYKTRPLAEIKDLTTLKHTLDDFILKQPTPDQVHDINPQTIERKMTANSGALPAIPDWMYQSKKK